MNINFYALNNDDFPTETDQVLTKYNPFDMTAVKARFAPYAEKIEEMTATAAAHEVKDTETSASAVEMAAQAKLLCKKIGKARTELVEKPYQFKKSVDSFAKGFTDKLDKITAILNKKAKDFDDIEEMKRREQEQLAREAAEKLQKQINAEAKKKNIEPVVVPVPVVPKTKSVIRTESGTLHIDLKWTWEETNFAEVPDEYKVLNRVSINQAVKNGNRNIPGIRIFEESKSVLRT